MRGDYEVIFFLHRVVLEAVPLQLDKEAESMSHDFPRSWILPVMKEYIEHTELAYFTQTMLPLAAQLRTKGGRVLSHDRHSTCTIFILFIGIQYVQAGKPLEAKLYATLQFQVNILYLNDSTCLSFSKIDRPFHRLLQ